MAGTPIVHKDLHVVNAVVGKYDGTADASGKKLFTLPANALVTRVTTHVATAATGGTPAFVVGTSGDTDALVASGDVTEGTVGVYTSADATLTAGVPGLLSADTDFIATVTEGSTVPGVFYVIVQYAYPFEHV